MSPRWFRCSATCALLAMVLSPGLSLIHISIIDRIDAHHLAGGRKLEELLLRERVKGCGCRIALAPGIPNGCFVASVHIDGGA